MLIARALLGVVALLGIGTAAAPDGALSVRVSNVRNTKGQVHVDVCPQAAFLKDCPYTAVAPAHEGVTVVTLHGLPAGTYAVQAFHDENSNRKVDRAIFGLPKEGVGFSNDAPIRMAPPKWEAARFTFDGHGQTIQLKLKYFL
ncbi:MULTISPECIES: DUF2141 domain-containing protein [unclassified Sphingomonas]|uniref:DUF2141 domain-containing protein n=1 Tax=unclassified Sphingomonas TaxID=196159 RepID=UPI00226AE40E|nr:MULTISPECIES: DUF2141 domain-containing protein [unclassified Sphingomonas]